MKFKDYDKNTWMIKKAKLAKVKDFNVKTNRFKNFKRTVYFKTDVPPEKRTLRNIPKYATGKNKANWQDWMKIKGQKLNPNHTACSFGKSECDGKWYGWSHRAVYGFGVGDTVKASADLVNDTGKDFVIKTDDQAKELAIKFAKEVG